MSIAGNESVYRWVPQTHDGTILESPVISLPRVTTIIGETLAKNGLMQWYQEMTVQGVEILLDQVLTNEPSRTRLMGIRELAGNLDEYLEVNRLRPTDIRDERATEGTEVHGFLQLLAMGEEPKSWYDDNYYSAVKNWWDQTRPEVVASEATLLSLRHGFAGSCDLVANLGATPRVVIDLKTRRVGQGARDSDHLQLAAYRIAWDEMHPNATCNGSYVLLAFDDGTWSLVPSDLDEGLFLNLLAIYNGLRRR